MRLASGGSHFGFLFVDLAPFIQVDRRNATLSLELCSSDFLPAGLPYGVSFTVPF